MKTNLTIRGQKLTIDTENFNPFVGVDLALASLIATDNPEIDALFKAHKVEFTGDLEPLNKFI